MSPLLRCPVCGELFDSATTSAMPFCGDRCRAIDLRRWLDEDIGIPIERSEESDEQAAEDWQDEP